jgi:hypothetical protein
VADEKQRHAIYQAGNFVFVFLSAVLIQAVEYKFVFNGDALWKQAVAGYTLVMIIYPLYANLSLKELAVKVGVGLFNLFKKKLPEIPQTIEIEKENNKGENEMKITIQTENETETEILAKTMAQAKGVDITIEHAEVAPAVEVPAPEIQQEQPVENSQVVSTAESAVGFEPTDNGAAPLQPANAEPTPAFEAGQEPIATQPEISPVVDEAPIANELPTAPEMPTPIDNIPTPEPIIASETAPIAPAENADANVRRVYNPYSHN